MAVSGNVARSWLRFGTRASVRVLIIAWSLRQDVVVSLKAARDAHIRKQWQQVHAQFRYVKNAHDNNAGYTSDGRRFFELQRDLNMYHHKIRQACAGLSRYEHQVPYLRVALTKYDIHMSS